MRRRSAAVGILATFTVALFVAASPTSGYSDGIAGSSGAIPEHLLDCQGDPPCTVRVGYCGTCHGTYEDMKKQEGANPTPRERIDVSFKVDGREDRFEYTPNQAYAIDILINDRNDVRPPGEYNAGGFDLNASVGKLSKWRADDPNVRITGGRFDHAGTKNESLVHPENGQRFGAAANVSEEQWAGEATHTARGSEVRSWRVTWKAPPASKDPHGVAFMLTVMLPDGDGMHSCTMTDCSNASAGPSPQSTWDWFAFMAPRYIMCEKDYYSSRQACLDAVYDAILPPGPARIACEPEDQQCQDATSEGKRPGTPVPPSFIFLALLGALGFARRRRC